MKKILTITNWLFGIFFLFIGLIELFSSVVSSIIFFTMAFILIPPVRKATYEKTKIKINFVIRGIILIVLFIAGIEHSVSDDQVAEYKAKNIQNEKINAKKEINEFFSSNRTEIIEDANAALMAKDYSSALTKSKKYLSSNDPEILRIYEKANRLEKLSLERKEKINREKSTNEYLAKLKNIPENYFEHNKIIYEELVKLNPDNSDYIDKLKYYTARYNSQLEDDRKSKELKIKQYEEHVAKFGEKPVQSSWDGTYYEVKKYLKVVARDPDSIDVDKCTQVYTTDDGWLVKCIYRGKNGFGGMNIEVNWFTIKNNKVINMEDESAHSP